MMGSVLLTAREYEYVVNEDGTAKIIRCLKKEKELVIPSSLDGRSVTAIAEAAFAVSVRMDVVDSVTLPDTVTDIEA